MSDRPRPLSVTRRGFVTRGGSFMTAGCMHRQSGVCGGCFARYYYMHQEMLRDPDRAAEIAREFDDAMGLDAHERRFKARRDERAPLTHYNGTDE